MNREAAIDAAARAGFESRTGMSWDDYTDSTRRVWREEAATCIEAALPHLQPQPIGYVVLDRHGRVESSVEQYVSAAERVASDWNMASQDPAGPYRVVALVPVDEP